MKSCYNKICNNVNLRSSLKKKKKNDRSNRKRIINNFLGFRAYYNILRDMFLLNLLQRYSFLHACSTKKAFGVEFYRRQCERGFDVALPTKGISDSRPLSSSLGISNSILGGSKNRFILRNNVVRTK